MQNISVPPTFHQSFFYKTHRLLTSQNAANISDAHLQWKQPLHLSILETIEEWTERCKDLEDHDACPLDGTGKVHLWNINNIGTEQDWCDGNSSLDWNVGHFRVITLDEKLLAVSSCRKSVLVSVYCCDKTTKPSWGVNGLFGLQVIDRI